MLRIIFVAFVMQQFYKFSSAQLLNEEQQYSVISPGTIRPNSQFNVVVSLPNAWSDSLIKLSIQSSNATVIRQKEVSIAPMSISNVEFQIPNIKDDTYTLTAEGIRGVVFSNSTILNFAADMPVVYVQTDKATYKPGDLVQFRVLFLDDNLFPAQIGKRVAIYIKNPDRGLQKQFFNIVPENGVLSAKLQLSNFTIIGKWSIDIMINSELIQTKTFHVAEYVLPRFEVIVNAPPKVAISESKLKFTVYSKYTFGKMVKGKAYVTIKSPRLKPVESEVDLKGNTIVEFDMDDIAPGYVHISYKLDVLVSVEEALTGIRQNATAEISLVRNRFQMTPQTLIVDCSNPLQTFNFSINIQNLNGEPISDTRNPVTCRHILPNGNYDDPDDDNDADRRHAMWTAYLNKSGVATIRLDCATYQASNFRITYKNETFRASTVRKQKTEASKSGLYVLTQDPKVGQHIEVQLFTHDIINNFVSVIVARGKIIEAQSYNSRDGSRSTRFSVMATYEMIPKAKIYIHYIYNNELTFFETSFNVKSQTHTANTISIEAPAETKPGDDITLKIITSPNSFVGLMGVDASVLLLKAGNDVRGDKILKELEKFETETPKQYLHTSSKYPGAEAGLITMTNAHYPHEPPNYERVPYFHKGNSTGMQLRKDFLETWFFDDIISTGGTNTHILKKKVPDTITSWIVTGFSINNELGFALTEIPIKIRSFKSLFISTNLPYSVKRDELVSIPVTLFNYLPRKVQAQISLEYKADEFDIINSTHCLKQGKCAKIMLVEANDGKTIHFIIRPKVIGSIPLNLKVTYIGGSDAIQKELNVEPEGVTVYENNAFYINNYGNRDYDFFTDTLKADIVPGSEYIEISVAGDILGSALTNLDDLVRMPVGCGEQNMIKFVPNLLLLEYLKGTQQLRPAIEKKMKKHIQMGYQNELSFRHADGSFSAFGKSEKSGSTWLTAYVVRWLSEASKNKYIGIESKTLRESYSFLVGKQADDGSFIEEGKLFFNARQNSVGLTAFVLLAFLKSSITNQDRYQDTIERGLGYLQNNIETTDDLYALSIAAYAMQLRKLPAAEVIMRNLMRNTRNDRGRKWWSKTLVTAEVESPKSQDVESTAYILMTLLDRNVEADYLLSIVKWLISQRNSNGGFASTQETVVGLQALVKYAEKHRVSDPNLEIEFVVQNDRKVLQITRQNTMALQTVKLPENTRSLTVNVNGMGAAVMQMSYRYNVLRNVTQPTQPSFQLTADLKAETISAERFNVEVCATYVADDTHKMSNMVLMEIALPSGLTAISESFVNITDQIDSVKLVDITSDKTKITVYFDNFEPHGKRCLTAQVERSFDVAKQKPVAINIYDYYDNQRYATQFYCMDSSACDICDTDDESYADCQISCKTNFGG